MIETVPRVDAEMRHQPVVQRPDLNMVRHAPLGQRKPGRRITAIFRRQTRRDKFPDRPDLVGGDKQLQTRSPLMIGGAGLSYPRTSEPSPSKPALCGTFTSALTTSR